MSKITQRVSDRADFSTWFSTLPRPPGKSSSADQSCKNAQEAGQRRDGRHGEQGQQAVPGDTGGWMGFCHSCLESCHTLALLSGYSLPFWHQPQTPIVSSRPIHPTSWTASPSSMPHSPGSFQGRLSLPWGLDMRSSYFLKVSFLCLTQGSWTAHPTLCLSST